jgi:uncharacterized protein
MKAVGRTESLWRYPVKSMRGEEVQEAFAGFPGVYSDLLYAFRSSASPKGFPWLIAREQEAMLLYRPRYRHPQRYKASQPHGCGSDRGRSHQGLRRSLRSHGGRRNTGWRTVVNRRPTPDENATRGRSRQARTGAASIPSSDDGLPPGSIFSLYIVRQLSDELGIHVDKRRFPRIGAKTTIAVVKRYPRCEIRTLDPDTAPPNPELMKHLARCHESQAGIYGAVLVEGVIRPGDDIGLLD